MRIDLRRRFLQAPQFGVRHDPVRIEGAADGSPNLGRTDDFPFRVAGGDFFGRRSVPHLDPAATRSSR